MSLYRKRLALSYCLTPVWAATIQHSDMSEVVSRGVR